MKVALLSNINLNMLPSFLDEKHEYFLSSGFNTLCQDLIDDNSEFYNYQCEMAFILIDANSVIDTCTSIAQASTEILSIIKYIGIAAKKHKGIKFFVNTIDILQSIASCKDNIALIELKSKYLKAVSDSSRDYNNIYIWNFEDCIFEVSRKNFYSDKLKYLSQIPFSMQGQKAISKEINCLLRIYEGRIKKCIIVDLDNTLWGGVIGEDGLSGLKLSTEKEGRVYYDVQRILKMIKEAGAILCIASKNNLEDGLQPFRKHEFCVLKEDDFVIKKINWNEKTQSIEEISKELNIGLDSIVFLDDNNIEREKIKNRLPMVTVVDFPTDIVNLPNILRELYFNYFNILQLTKEDKSKTQDYLTEEKRKQDKNESIDIDEYIKSLKIKINLHKISENEVPRIAQLTQKTNQFNLTTKRFTDHEIADYMLKNKIYCADVSDKYGDYGIVFVIMLKEFNGSIEIDNLLMSCRVMGRNVEQSIISSLQKNVFLNYNCIYGTFMKSNKNQPVEKLLESFGFELYKEIDCTKLLKTAKIKPQKVLCDVTFIE